MTIDSVLLIGCGNMAGAMLTGWLAAGRNPANFTIVDPALAGAPHDLPQDVRVLATPPENEIFDAVLLGIKPQLLAEVAPFVEPLIGPDTLLLSILAGVRLDALGAHFERAKGCVRIMPNLAAALGKSPMALAAQGIDAGQRNAVTELLHPLGTPEWVKEDAFDLMTALAGSGPAFVYRFIDALAGAAADLGMDAGVAARLAGATVEGAVALAATSEHDPGELARRVASPGGVTEAGLGVLDQDEALQRLLKATLQAAQNRSAQMAAEAGRKDGA